MTTEKIYNTWMLAVTNCVYVEKIRTQVYIAKKTGIERQSLNSILKKRKNKKASSGLQDRISSALGYTYEELINMGLYIEIHGSAEGWVKPIHGTVQGDMPLWGGSGSGKSEPAKPEIPSGTTVPVISWVQAGAWSEIVDEFQPGDADQFVLVCRNVSANTFALKISGDSMAPEFLPGEIIIVDPEVQPETGKFVVAKIDNGNGEEATFKLFIRDGSQIFLKPLNDTYPLIDMTGKDFRIVGCVVQKTKEY